MATTRSPELATFYSDIIITAVEGGTNYWAYVSQYQWSDIDPEQTRAYLADMEEYDEDRTQSPEDHEKEGNPWNLVTLDTVSKAFGIIMGPKEDIGLNDSLRARYSRAYREKDCGDIDAGDADNIVQIGIFEKVVYG